jgi:hypothetical protein
MANNLPYPINPTPDIPYQAQSAADDNKNPFYGNMNPYPPSENSGIPQGFPDFPYPGQPAAAAYPPQPFAGIPGQNQPYPSQNPYPAAGQVQPSTGQGPPIPGQNPPYTGQPQPYPGQPQPYPGQTQPYPGQPQPYPGQNQPYPGQNQPYPSQPQPYPGQNPGVSQPYPGQNPGAGQPYPGQQQPSAPPIYPDLSTNTGLYNLQPEPQSGFANTNLNEGPGKYLGIKSKLANSAINSGTAKVNKQDYN